MANATLRLSPIARENEASDESALRTAKRQNQLPQSSSGNAEE
jgi:hypothetical protein